jgi:hypothetical protein
MKPNKQQKENMMKKDLVTETTTPEDEERQDQLEAILMGCLNGSSSEDNTEAALFDIIHGSPDTIEAFGLLFESVKAVLNERR